MTERLFVGMGSGWNRGLGRLGGFYLASFRGVFFVWGFGCWVLWGDEKAVGNGQAGASGELGGGSARREVVGGVWGRDAVWWHGGFW